MYLHLRTFVSKYLARKHPEYIQAVILCFLRKMKKLSLEGALWLNRRELAKTKYAKLNSAFAGYNGIFEHFQIGFSDIRDIQMFSWENSNESCDARQYTNETEFRTVSRVYTYKFDKMDSSVHFDLQFYRKRIQKEVECSIFLKIFTMPPGIVSVATEMDIICHCDGDVHRSLMRKQKLLAHGSTKGIVVFRSENIHAKSSISWKFALQMEPKRRQFWIEDRFPLEWMPRKVENEFFQSKPYILAHSSDYTVYGIIRKFTIIPNFVRYRSKLIFILSHCSRHWKIDTMIWKCTKMSY